VGNPKFKVGDRVVRINSQASHDIPIFSAGTVVGASFMMIDAVVVEFDIRKKAVDCFDGNLEYENIFNTPLYQALK
jgi:hypothetical protein